MARQPEGRPEGLARLDDLGRRVFEEIQALPPQMSAPQPAFDQGFKPELAALKHNDWFKIHGGDERRGVIWRRWTTSPMRSAS